MLKANFQQRFTRTELPLFSGSHYVKNRFTKAEVFTMQISIHPKCGKCTLVCLLEQIGNDHCSAHVQGLNTLSQASCTTIVQIFYPLHPCHYLEHFCSCRNRERPKSILPVDGFLDGMLSLSTGLCHSPLMKCPKLRLCLSNHF